MTPRTLSLAVTLTLSLAACGGGADGPSGGSQTAKTPRDLARLVPADATVFVQLGSIESLERTVEGLGVGDGFHFDPADVLGTMGVAGVDGARIARDRPWGVAMALDDSSPMPVLTVVLPVDDAEAFLAGWTPAQPGQSSASAGSYVGFSTAPGYAAADTPGQLAMLPTHVFAMRADLATLIERLRPLIDTQLAQVEALLDQSAGEAMPEGMDAGAAMDAYFDLFDSFLDSATALELSLADDGDMLALDATLEVAPGSPLDGFADGGAADAGSLGAMIDPEAPISFAMVGDMSRLFEALLPMYDQLFAIYPEPMRGQLTGYMNSFKETYPLFGRAMAGSMQFDESGMSMAFFAESPDPAALSAKYRELLSAESEGGVFWEVGEAEDLELGGRAVTRIPFSVDAEAMAAMLGDGGAAEVEGMLQAMMSAFIGPEGTRVYLADTEQRLAMVMSNDEGFVASGLDRIDASGGELPRELSFAFTRCRGASPMLAYRVDVPHLIGELATMLPMLSAEAPAELAGHSVPAVFYCGASEHTWRMGMALPPADLASLIAALTPQ